MALSQQLVLVCALIAPCFTLSVAGTGSRDVDGLPSFALFHTEHGRTYTAGSKEYGMRQGLYEQRRTEVQQHNSKPQRRWSATVNHLSDRTEVELSQLRGLRSVRASKGGRGVVRAHSGQFLGQIKNAVVPAETSWAHLNGAKMDFDQAACGSCWAIAAATMLTANAEIKGYNRTFSAQELVSCTPNPHDCGGKGGCDGATVELAMNWVMEQGLDDSTQTPYLGKDDVCKKRSTSLLSKKDVFGDATLEEMIAVGFHGVKNKLSSSVQMGLNGWTRLPENQYEPLIRAVAETGPVAVSVGASGWSSYSSGLFDDCSKDVTVDHAVTLIGYGGVNQKDKYWTIKNSWGLQWGENGNIRLFREEGNVHCGTDYDPKAGTACNNGPKTVPVCGMCGILFDSVVAHFKKM